MGSARGNLLALGHTVGHAPPIAAVLTGRSRLLTHSAQCGLRHIRVASSGSRPCTWVAYARGWQLRWARAARRSQRASRRVGAASARPSKLKFIIKLPADACCCRDPRDGGGARFGSSAPPAQVAQARCRTTTPSRTASQDGLLAPRPLNMGGKCATTGALQYSYNVGPHREGPQKTPQAPSARRSAALCRRGVPKARPPTPLARPRSAA